MKWLFIGTGIVLVGGGLLVLWLPLPLGLPMLLLGLPLLAKHSPHARRWLKRFCRRYPLLSRRLFGSPKRDDR